MMTEAKTLAKRATKTARDSNAAVGMNPAEPPEREYVPFEDDSRGDRDEFSNGEERAVGAGSAREGKTEKPSMQEIFGPGGFLEKCMYGGYEHRQGQLEMAEIVHDAFETHHHAIVEAGTGTGKTLAYLLPAISSGRRVVISTATKSLQEQLYQKDIPFLQKHFAPKLKVAVMKGRGNFLCRAKLHAMADAPMLKGLEELDAFRQMRDWAKLTETGDRAELTFLADDSDLWTR